MPKENFFSFRERYLSVMNNVGKLVLSQLEKCQTCKEQDYRACLKECVELTTTLKQIEISSKQFPWIGKRGVFNLLTLTKSIVKCRAWGIKDEDLEPEVEVPKISRLPENDRQVLRELFKTFSTTCKLCVPSSNQNCLECREIRKLEAQLKSSEGRKAFWVHLIHHAEYKRNTEPQLESEIRFFYERIYFPPVSLDVPTPKDPWAFYAAVKI